jgi:flagellar L-ring protein precursor FlgH
MPLGPGDLVTVVVDEQTAARERVSRIADGNRSMNNRLNLDTPTGAQGAALQTGSLTNSRDVGEAGRVGNLTAVLTVRVVSVEPTGALRIQGHRRVTVDGRLQDIALDGVVRAEDVDGSNRVLSSRIADARHHLQGREGSARVRDPGLGARDAVAMSAPRSPPHRGSCCWRCSCSPRSRTPRSRASGSSRATPGTSRVASSATAS